MEKKIGEGEKRKYTNKNGKGEWRRRDKRVAGRRITRKQEEGGNSSIEKKGGTV